MVENPDRVIIAGVERCQYCQADLKEVEPDEIKQRQITERPTAKPVVIETRRHETTCPHCHLTNYGALPEGLEAERYFGPNLEGAIIYYKQEQYMSWERIVETMRDLHGVTLSEGAVVQILERAGERPNR
jgi:transposase